MADEIVPVVPVVVPVVPATPVAPDLVKAVDGLIAKYGDSNGALRVLLGENHDYRDQVRVLKAAAPAAGSVILTADEGKALSAYRALGTPDEVKAAFDERGTLRTDVAETAREKLHAEAAGLHGFKASVLSTLAKNSGVELVIQDAKDKAGKDIKVAAVKGEGDKTELLTAYADKHWKDFLPALKVEAPKGAPIGSPARTGTGAPRPQTETRERNAAPRRNSF